VVAHEAMLMSRNKIFIQQKVEQLFFDNRFHYFNELWGDIVSVSIITLFEEWSYESLEPNRWKIVIVHTLVEYEG
jgi:hypothetical protein